ncbi:hypothetical protein [Nonomuraea sp. NPDC050786]|uniref:hypothetical protein n=1 Tax=Nonomuraea sp. NPDC050786 TaxID=3154840 RepID=UPI0033F36DE5
MDSFDMIVTAHSNPLEQKEFERQVAMIKPHMDWDPVTRTWRVRLSSSRAEHATEVLNALFEAARVYGTAVVMQLAPTEQPADPPASSL